MNILWIISSGWNEGGAENYLTLMRPIMEKKGHVIKILASNDHPEMPHFSDYSYNAHRGIFRGLFHTINPSAYFALKKVLREFEPDIVHVHTIGHGSPAILFPLRHYPTFLTMHGPDGFMKSLRLWCFPNSYFQNGKYDMDNIRLIGKLRLLYHRFISDPLYAIGFRNIDTIISPSSYMKRLVDLDGYSSVYVPNGTQLFPYHPIAKSNLTRSIIFVGRLETYKGVHVLLHAFALVVEECPDARLVIVGDGTERDTLKQLARELNIFQVTEFLGRVDRSQLEALYGRSTIAVMPSLWVEAFGLVGVEAMSVGRPVIASRVGGIPDWLIDGKTGYLVTPGDSEELARAILRLLLDPVLLLEMMKNARARAEEFDIRKHTEKILELYAKAVLRDDKIA